MKKILGLLLTAVILVGLLAGCSKTVETELEGTWQGKLVFAQLLTEKIESQELKQIIEGLDLSATEASVSLTFRNDGTYALSVDLESLEEALNKVSAAVQSVELPQEVKDELSKLGLDADGLLSVVKSIFSGSENKKDAAIQGNFKDEGGKVYLSMIKGVGLYTDTATNYRVEGNTLTLESISGDSLDVMKLLAPFFPLTLTK